MNSKWECEELPENYPESNLNFKIVVIGDAGVGKSCLTNCAVKKNFKFDNKYNITIGFEFSCLKLKLNNKLIQLQIWLIIYNDRKESFENIDYWIKELREKANPDIKVVLVGNKSDLEIKREVISEDLDRLCQENKNISFCMETSAKNGNNIKNLFRMACEILYLEYLKYNDENEDTKCKSSFSIKHNDLDELELSTPQVTIEDSLKQKKCSC